MTSPVRALCGALFLAVLGCGGGASKMVPPPPLPSRMMVSSNSSDAVIVVDAMTDAVRRTLTTPSPGKMVSAGGTTLIQSTRAASLAIFDNASETIRSTVLLPALAVDVAITPDGKTGWVAESNGTVQSVDTASGAITGTTPFAGVQRLVMGPQGLTLLAFNDSLAINFMVIPSQGHFFEIGNAGLDHPANGVFEGDDNHFIVMNCGGECAGTQAGVAGVSLNNIGGPFVSSPLALSGATVGLLNGSSMFVAGSPAAGLDAGTVQVVNNSAFTAGPPINIADGRHGLMAITSNGRLYIGAVGCTLGAINAQNQRQGCLTILDTVTSSVTAVLLPVTRANGDVTSLAPVPGRSVIYVVQGGKLDIFDITTNAVSTTATPPSIPGTVFGAVQVSP